MNFKALFLSLIVGGLLIFISKWLFIVNLFLIPFLLNKYWRQSSVCPDCGHIQNDNICIMNEENRSILEHGRRTKSSTLDKRYNSQFSNTTTITYGIECNKCNTTYKSTSTFES